MAAASLLYLGNRAPSKGQSQASNGTILELNWSSRGDLHATGIGIEALAVLNQTRAKTNASEKSVLPVGAVFKRRRWENKQCTDRQQKAANRYAYVTYSVIDITLSFPFCPPAT